MNVFSLQVEENTLFYISCIVKFLTQKYGKAITCFRFIKKMINKNLTQFLRSAFTYSELYLETTKCFYLKEISLNNANIYIET